MFPTSVPRPKPLPCPPVQPIVCGVSFVGGGAIGNCTYTIYDIKPGPPPPPCCVENEWVVEVPAFVPVEDEVIEVASGSGFLTVEPENLSREEFGLVNSSRFTLAIRSNCKITQGQWVKVRRTDGLKDHGEIVAIDRRNPGYEKLIVDTGKAWPLKTVEC